MCCLFDNNNKAPPVSFTVCATQTIPVTGLGLFCFVTPSGAWITMKYFGLADIKKRWVYTPQGILKLRKTEDFPKPIFTLNQERTPVWLALDIAAYEVDHPEVLDVKKKREKVGSYARCIMKKRRAAQS
jgi:hypothetical protein